MNCIAIDIGAGSGRVIQGTFDSGKLRIEELHRFGNSMELIDGHLRWDITSLFQEVCKGLKIASKCRQRPSSIGVDTWGVDFVLLDADSKLIELPVAYRDNRTEGMMERFLEKMDRGEVYERTGIQFMPINTLYQLFSVAQREPVLLRKASHLLMISDYLNFLLTGEMCMEFTNATTTQMLSVSTKDWDNEILSKVPLDPDMFQRPIMPGKEIGALSPDVQARTGLGDVPVIAPATHDTGSAVASVPAKGKDWAFISSGTWSLMGKEVGPPICTKEALANNFTNEGGVQGTYRFLKNNMGLWLLEGLRKALPGRPSYAKLVQMASKARAFSHLVDPNSGMFFNPRSMKKAFDDFFRATRQPIPKFTGTYIRCALESLALSYRGILFELTASKVGRVSKVHIIGGGSQNRLLDQMTANALGLPVHTGPVEGTAVGNLLVQAIALGEVNDLSEGRQIVYRSFNIKKYTPKDREAWDRAWERYKAIRRVANGKTR